MFIKLNKNLKKLSINLKKNISFNKKVFFLFFFGFLGYCAHSLGIEKNILCSKTPEIPHLEENLRLCIEKREGSYYDVQVLSENSQEKIVNTAPDKPMNIKIVSQNSKKNSYTPKNASTNNPQCNDDDFQEGEIISLRIS